MFTPLEKKRKEVLDSILYISIPEDMDLSHHDMILDPTKLLPVEVSGDPESWNIEELSWEMIIAGMLKILAFQNTHEDAEYYRNFVLAARPAIIQELTETAIVKANNNDFDLSEEIFLALVGLQPNEQRPLLNLALLYDKRAEVAKNTNNDDQMQYFEDQAYHWYREVTTADEPLAESYLYAGYFFLRIQNYTRAKEVFESYQSLGEDVEHLQKVKAILNTIQNQNLSDTLFKEAYDFIRMSRENEGLTKIDQFLSENPEVWNGWFLKGWALRRLQNFDTALESFTTCMNCGGKNPDTLNEMAICLIELNKLEEAKKLLFEALQMDTDNTKIISNLGIVQLKAGETEEALRYFEAVLEFDPEDPMALHYIQHIQNIS